MEIQSVLQQRDKVDAFQRRHRIGLLTLVFSDMIDSTALKQSCGDTQAVGLFQQHHALIRGVRRQFEESEEIDTAGGSFFMVFARPSDAVKFALMAQAQIRALARQTGQPIRDRFGIHLGEVLIQEEQTIGKPTDLFGLQVDICARVASLAGADQVLVSRSVFDSARQILKGSELSGVGELSWLSHGRYQLKGIEEAVEICEVGEPGLAALRPPTDSEKARRTPFPEAQEIPGWRPALGEIVPNTQWILERKLGEGGFGEVWQTWHPALRERRVFKFCFHAARARSLKREVTLFRMVRDKAGNHPNLVRLFEVNLSEVPYYLEEEYVEGQDIKTWCQARGGFQRLPLARRLEIVAQAAEGLQTAHALGIIHRDIKPSNILVHGLENGGIQVKVADFGIGKIGSDELIGEAALMGFSQTISTENKLSGSGTLAFSAPELLTGAGASSQSDVYSMGVFLYQMIIGDFSKPLTIDWAREIDDSRLRDILRKCCAGEPSQRFTRAGDLAEALRAVLRNPRRLRSSALSFRRLPPKRKLMALAWVFAIAVVSAFLADSQGFFRRLELMTFDSRMRWAVQRNPEVANDLRTIFIDTRALRDILKRLNSMGDSSSDTNIVTFPWPRFIYGRLARELRAQGATATAFNVLFDLERPNDPGLQLATGEKIPSDLFFAQEIARAGNVLLAAEKEALPATVFRTNGCEIGLIGFLPDLDGVMRRTKIFIDAGKRRIWNLGLLLAAKGLGLDLQNATVEADRIICHGPNGLVRTIPVNDQMEALPLWNLTGPEIRRQSETSLANLLALDYGRQKLGGGLSQGFQHTMVVVGSGRTGDDVNGGADALEDNVSTPMGRAFGTAVMLNMANSLLIGRFVHHYSRGVLLATVVFAAGLGLAFLWQGPNWRSATKVAIMLCALWAAGYQVMGLFDYWLPLVAPAIATLLAVGLLRIYCAVLSRSGPS